MEIKLKIHTSSSQEKIEKHEDVWEIWIHEKPIDNLAKNTKKTVAQLEKDTDRDHWLDASEAIKYGIVDKVIEKC